MEKRYEYTAKEIVLFLISSAIAFASLKADQPYLTVPLFVALDVGIGYLCYTKAGAPWKRAAVWLASTGVLIGILVLVYLVKTPAESEAERRDSEIISELKDRTANEELKERYPLGYTIFYVDTVTSAVTPEDVWTRMNQYEFDFRNVRAKEDLDGSIEVDLPDIYLNGQPSLTGGHAVADPQSFSVLRPVMTIGATPDGERVMGVAQILRVDKHRVLWLFGLSAKPPLPIRRPVR